MGNLTFEDISFSGGPYSSYDYQDAVITTSSSVSNLALVQAMSFKRCRFTPSSSQTRSPSSTVVWLPLIDQVISFDACYCSYFSYLIAPPGSSRSSNTNYDSRAQQISVTNSSFPSYRCAIHLPATKRLVRDVATVSGNSLHDGQPELKPVSRTSTPSRLCHSFQGYKRVDMFANNFARDFSTVQDWPSEFCLHLTGSRFVISQNNMSSVSWVRISPDASITMANNSLAPIFSSGIMADFPTISPDLGCSKSSLNLRQNWWGYVDGPRLTQYNGTYKETYQPWYLSADQTLLSVSCPEACSFNCDYTTGKCNPLQLDQLTIIGIAVTTSFAALFIAFVFLFPYCRFYCCRPLQYA
jgi:hypothetical protein